MAPKLCLNMIVKNESKIILRLLNSVVDILDNYCMCDTGSTDNTISLIKEFFDEKQIPGNIIEEPFQDFAYNRSFALRACDELDADYILLLDADMIFWRDIRISPSDFKNGLLPYDYCYLYQGSDTFYYKNTRVVKNHMGFYYKGVTHEYVETPRDSKSGPILKDIAFIRDIGDGGAKNDKFIRDIRLLKGGLEKEPNNERYLFYLANSLKDSNQKEEAIEYYKKRIERGGWIEEVWYSYFNIGKCYWSMGETEKAIYSWMAAYNEYPNRIENLYEIVQHYRVIGKHKLAFIFYQMAMESKKKYPEHDYLFMQKDIYDYKLEYEFSILGYYYNPFKTDLAALSMNILQYPHIEEGIAKNILSNYKFYAPFAKEHDTHNWDLNDFGKAVSTIGRSLNLPPLFVSSSPTLCAHPKDKNQMYVMIRFVNYRVKDDGGYHCEDNIETINVLALLELKTDVDANVKKTDIKKTDIKKTEKKEIWTIIREDILKYDTSYDNLYVGLEDVRLMMHGDKIYYSCNRGLSRGKMVVEHGWINRINFTTMDIVHLKIENQHKIEKNWIMLPSVSSSIHMVYNWYPLRIGKVVNDEFQTLYSYETPYFFKYIRGSTNGILVENEVFLICHLVSYEDRRYYYHVVIVLDSITFNLKRFSKLFTFEKEKVEYTLGLQYIPTTKEFLIGYSVLDRQTKWITLQAGNQGSPHPSFFG